MFLENKLLLKITILAPFLFFLSMSYAERYKRPMVINKVKRMGLEIWTEMEPSWKTELIMNGKKPIFVAYTPSNVYPPSGMTWVNHSEVQLTPVEFPEIARSTLETAAKNYKFSKKLSELVITPKIYGSLNGFEINFIGLLDKKYVDVRVFTGRSNGRGPVTMQAYAPKGKLKHLKEQIRRSWTHTRYLDN